MKKTPEKQMTDEPPRHVSTPKLVAIAVVFGLLAGAGAVYVNAMRSGNVGTASSGSKTVAVAASPECEPARETAQSLTKYAVGAVAAMAPQDEPRLMSGLSFKDADGNSTTLADYAGKTLLVNLWATWCVPCRAEMPALDRLQAKMGGAEFEVVAINIDTGDETKPVKFLKEIGVKSIALHRDETMGVFNDLKKEGLAFGLPVTLLVGKKGCLLAAMNGPAEWDGEDAAKLVTAAIAAQEKGAADAAPGKDAASAL